MYCRADAWLPWRCFSFLQVWSASDQDWTCKIDEVSNLADPSRLGQRIIACEGWLLDPLFGAALMTFLCRGRQVSAWEQPEYAIAW